MSGVDASGMDGFEDGEISNEKSNSNDRLDQESIKTVLISH